MEDPFRREPRNVGVIARFGDTVAARFVGQAPNGELDGRKIRFAKDPAAYRQWVAYWTNTASAKSWKDELIGSSKRNYLVVDGGNIANFIDAEKAIDSLFSQLVSDEIAENDGRPEVDKELKRKVHSLFRDSGLMSNQVGAGHAGIYSDKDLLGHKQFHRFTFVQVNGAKRPMEVFDFNRSARKNLERHAGWSKTAFLDIHEAGGEVHPFALMMPPTSASREDVYKYSRQILNEVCEFVDLSSNSETDAFLTDCRTAAGFLPM